MNPPRVAFFTDSYHEVNGVALTSRQFHSFARRRGLPFLAVAAARGHSHGPEADLVELPTSPASFPLEFDLRFDLAFLRHRNTLRRVLDRFRPDLIHITGPGHLGILGTILAHERRIPLAASWHTNIHEFGARRLEALLRFLAQPLRHRLCQKAQRGALEAAVRFYRLARVSFAPNRDLVDLLRSRTRRPCFLMERGISAEGFCPSRRRPRGNEFVLGYVGRLSPEKNVRFLARLEAALSAAGLLDYRFLVVGDGSERRWLAANLRQAELPGVLRGEALAAAYAGMDLFVFPSHTDTFGNVVLEAAASGVPAVVTNQGGPRFLVHHGGNGIIARNDEEFCDAVLQLYRHRPLLAQMGQFARASALNRSWDAVFDGVYQHYAECVATAPREWPERVGPPSPAPCLPEYGQGA